MLINETFGETGESIFSTITRLAREYDAINLGQGFPNFNPPESLRNKLADRVDSSFSEHQYAPSPGVMDLRRQVARLYREQYGLNYDPELEITITTGATEALSSSLYGLLNEGDEVVLFDPVYDLYAPVARRAGATTNVIPLTEPEFELPVKRLKREVSADTDLIVLNNPHNPTGRVFTEAELQEIVHVARAHDITILSDEVYEQLTYGEAEHRPLAGFEGARNRTLSIGSVGKLFNATGWKIGWVLAPESLTRAVRSSHQFTTFATATPLQVSVAEFLESHDARTFLAENRRDYDRRREILLEGLSQTPFEVIEPQGTYFVVVRVPDELVPDAPDPGMELVKQLVKDHGIAAIPLSSFYVANDPEACYLRFAFCKQEPVLEEAADQLRSI